MSARRNQIEDAVTQIPRADGGSTVVSVHTGSELARTQRDVAERLAWLRDVAHDDRFPGIQPDYVHGKLVRHAMSPEEAQFVRQVEEITGMRISLPGEESNPLVRVAQEALREHRLNEQRRLYVEKSQADYLKNQRRLGPVRHLVTLWKWFNNHLRPEGAELFKDYN